jgi:hypothetical protein
VSGQSIMRTATLAILAAAALTLATATPAHAHPACLMGSGQYTAPITVCTPGAYVHLSTAAVCATKDRPSLPAVERRKILARYGLTTWTGRDGELDHLQPLFLGGTTDARNIWPEAQRPGNPKDRLENYVRRRVCLRKPYPMSVRTARREFLTDWRPWYRRYFAS